MASRAGKGNTIAQAPDKTSPQRQQGTMIADSRIADCDKPEAQARVDVAGQIIHAPLFDNVGEFI